MMVMAVGMGLVMAPATESIMGSLPPAKAGVGSAMNDTTRQMGGALGVAVLGSVLASSYRPAVQSSLQGLGLPDEAVSVAQDSVGGAFQVAARLPGDLGATVIDAASQAFVTAFHSTVLVAAAVLLVAAAVVFRFLPARAGDPREPFEGPLDGLASLTFAEAEGALEQTVPAAEAVSPAGGPATASGAATAGGTKR